MEKDTVNLNEEKGEETYGDEDHAVELVTGTHKNPHYPKVYQRHTRDRLHVEIDVRSTTAEDTKSAMANLMGSIEESTSGVTDHKRTYATSHGEQYSHFLPWQSDCQKQVDHESLQGESCVHEERSMSSNNPNSVSTYNVRLNGRTTF